MFEKYTDIIYNGNYEAPIHITFKKTYLTLTGEGGNRRLIIGDKNGYMNLWIDTHTYGKYFAFLGDVAIEGNPSSIMVNRVWRVISETVEKNNCLLKWTEKELNNFFERLYFFSNNRFYI